MFDCYFFVLGWLVWFADCVWGVVCLYFVCAWMFLFCGWFIAGFVGAGGCSLVCFRVGLFGVLTLL